MDLKSSIKFVFERLFKLKLIRRYPFGIDQISDIQYRFPEFEIKVVLDVGANVGQSVEFFSTRVSKAKIYSIEPGKQAFHQLKENTKANPNVMIFNFAIGQKEGTGTLLQTDESTNQKIKYGEVSEQADCNTVEIVTLGKFCGDNGISRINYLKIDTEGFDLEVLKSAEKLLLDRKIDFIEVEAGMSNMNTDHVPFNDLHIYLQSKGYYLFGIYDQYAEWKLKKNCLRRCNPVFVSDRLI